MMEKYTITQLTDNELDDITVQTSKGNAVWSGSDGDDDEIYFYDGDSTSRLTYNDAFDNAPQISGNNVAWQQTESALGLSEGSGVLVYDGKTEKIDRIADVDGFAIPGISGKNVVWGVDLIFGGEVSLYNGKKTSELTDLGVFIPINSASVSGENVVWTSGFDEDFEGFGDIFLYDGEETVNITDNASDDFVNVLPSVSGDNIAWSAAEVPVTGTGTADIFLYDGEETIQLTEDDIQDAVVGISGDNVIWASGDGFTESELFLYDGEETIQLTSEDTDIFTGGSISGNNVVWSESDGEDTEIFLYDGKSTTQITDNDLDDNLPDLDGDTIVWEGDDGNDTEIFLATIDEAEDDSDSKAYRLTDNDDAFGQSRDPLTGQNKGSLPLFETFEAEDISQDVADFNFTEGFVAAETEAILYPSSIVENNSEDLINDRFETADLILPSTT